jgi:hypothetical protein
MIKLEGTVRHVPFLLGLQMTTDNTNSYRSPENLNQLAQYAYKFTIRRMPNVNYFMKDFELPGISVKQIKVGSQTNYINLPGVKLDFSTLDMQFFVDENLANYKEIADWLFGVGRPFDGEDRVNYIREMAPINPSDRKGIRPIFSDGTLFTLTNARIKNVEINFQELLPISLSELKFVEGETDVLMASVTFMFDSYMILPRT